MSEEACTEKCHFDSLLRSETVLYIMSFLSAADSAKVNLVSRRFLYFSEKLGGIQPSLVTRSSKTFAPKALMSSALAGLSVGRPNVAFCFYSEQCESPDWLRDAMALLPDN